MGLPVHSHICACLGECWLCSVALAGMLPVLCSCASSSVPCRTTTRCMCLPVSSCRLENLPLLLQICCGIYLITWLIFMLFMQTVQKEKGEELHPQLSDHCS